MQPSSFPEQNKIYTKPEGWTDEECGDLSVWQGNYNNGTPVIISYWKPTPDDMATLNSGGGIYLQVCTSVQPPVLLTTETPFYRNEDIKQPDNE